jgi:hypothetical protein
MRRLARVGLRADGQIERVGTLHCRPSAASAFTVHARRTIDSYTSEW